MTATEISQESLDAFKILAEFYDRPWTSRQGGYYVRSSYQSLTLVNFKGACISKERWQIGRTSEQRKLAMHFPSPGVFLGTVEQLALMYMQGKLPRDSYAVFAEIGALNDPRRTMRQELEELGRQLGELIDGTRPELDVELEEIRDAHGKKLYVPRCHKPIPAKVYVGYAKKMFPKLAQAAWGLPFLHGEDETGGAAKGVLRESRAKNLAIGLLCPDGLRAYPPALKGGRNLTAAQVKGLSLGKWSTDESDDRVRTARETLRHLEDYPKLWQKASDDTHLAIRLPVAVLDDLDETIDIMSTSAKAYELAGYVDAYQSGVPLEDILA